MKRQHPMGLKELTHTKGITASTPPQASSSPNVIKPLKLCQHHAAIFTASDGAAQPAP